MNNNNTNTPRVVRTGAKTKKRKKPQKPLSPGLRIAKTIAVSVAKVLVTTILVLTITGCIVGTALTIYVMEFIDAESPIDLNAIQLNYTAIVYAKDKEGNDVEVQRLNKMENRIWVSLDKIPEDLKDAVVYTEDERFYDHDGVDFKRTFAAFANLVLKKDDGFGGSTITQQLIKNINGDINKDKRTIDVKIKEIIGAMNLERHFSKEQILESYLNYISLHNNINGVQAGAQYYFGKDVSELSLVECASLAVISKSPSSINPISNPERNKERRQYALDKMLEHGKITQEEYDGAYNEELVLAKTNTVNQSTAPKKAQSYFIDSVTDEIITDLVDEYDYSRERAEQLLLTSGWSIYTTMEIETNNILENYFADVNNFYNPKDTAKQKAKVPDQAYMVIMNYEGNVVAVAGGKGPKAGDRVLNRATTSKRPAGSTIKPLSVYTPAFEHDLITWSTVMEDSAVMKVKDEKTGALRDWPSNYNHKYEGPMSIIEAIKVSKNTIPVRLIQMLTPQVSFDYVYNQLHLTSLRSTGGNNDVGEASLALGDGGTILDDLTAAFQIFGNGGYYIEHKMYSKVVDTDGTIILDTTNRKKSRVMSPDTAYIMNKALWRVVNEKPGSGTAAKLSKWQTIGKTGTSNDRKDLLFMGLSPYYVGGIRYGNDNNSVIEYDGKSQIKVWKEVMELVHKDLNPANFELPASGVVEMTYCVESGDLAHAGCTKKKAGFYKGTNIPPSCSLHNFDGTVNLPEGVEGGASSGTSPAVTSQPAA